MCIIKHKNDKELEKYQEIKTEIDNIQEDKAALIAHRDIYQLLLDSQQNAIDLLKKFLVAFSIPAALSLFTLTYQTVLASSKNITDYMSKIETTLMTMKDEQELSYKIIQLMSSNYEASVNLNTEQIKGLFFSFCIFLAIALVLFIVIGYQINRAFYYSTHVCIAQQKIDDFKLPLVSISSADNTLIDEGSKINIDLKLKCSNLNKCNINKKNSNKKSF